MKKDYEDSWETETLITTFDLDEIETEIEIDYWVCFTVFRSESWTVRDVFEQESRDEDGCPTIRTLKSQKRSEADCTPSSASRTDSNGGRRKTQDEVGSSSSHEPCLGISFLLKAILFKPNQPNELFDLDLADLDDLGLNNDDEIQEIKKSKEGFQCQPIID